MSTIEERLAVISDALQEIDGERGTQLMALRPLLPAIERLIRGETRYGQNLGGCSTEETQKLMRVFNIHPRRSHITPDDIEWAMSTAASHHHYLPQQMFVGPNEFVQLREAFTPNVQVRPLPSEPQDNQVVVIDSFPAVMEEAAATARAFRLKKQRRIRKGKRQ